MMTTTEDTALARAKASIKRQAERVARLLHRPAPAPIGKRRPIQKPTPEQRQKVAYDLDEVLDRDENGRTLVLGKAYKRRPWFETMHARSMIDGTDLKVLRFYRRVAETCARSELKSCLNRDIAGGSGTGSPPPAVVEAAYTLAMCEDAIGSVLDTVRAVALDDMPYRSVAMARWGSRERVADRAGIQVTVIEPVYKQHPRWIEDEFLLGLHRLRQWAEPYLRLER